MPDGLPVDDSDLCLRPVEHLLELADAMAHARVHVRLRALDVVVEVVAEKLDVCNGRIRDDAIGEVAGEEDESDITDVFRVIQSWQMSNLERWVTGGVENLRSTLDGR